MIDPAILRQCWPGVRDADGWCRAINTACARWAIQPGAELAAFLAQTGHECGEGAALAENMNYLRAEHILDVHGLRACRSAEAKAAARARQRGQAWPALAVAEAAELVRQPQRLASRVYAGMNGNGDEASGDGWRFRGGGAIQVTGRAAFDAYGLALGISAAAAAARASSGPDGAADSAGWYWAWRGCQTPARAGDFDRVCCLVAGRREAARVIGIDDRRARYARARAALG
jgi:putative chitinase